MAGAALHNSLRLGQIEPTFSVMESRASPLDKFTIISVNPNRPIEMATKSMPSWSSAMPKSKRKVPELTSAPMIPRRRPKMIMAKALSTEPLANTTAPTRPKTIRLKYSAGPNLKASSIKGGAKAATKIVAKQPAIKEPIAAIPRAVPAFPWRAIW